MKFMNPGIYAYRRGSVTESIYERLSLIDWMSWENWGIYPGADKKKVCGESITSLTGRKEIACLVRAKALIEEIRVIAKNSVANFFISPLSLVKKVHSNTDITRTIPKSCAKKENIFAFFFATIPAKKRYNLHL